MDEWLGCMNDGDGDGWKKESTDKWMDIRIDGWMDAEPLLTMILILTTMRTTESNNNNDNNNNINNNKNINSSQNLLYCIYKYNNKIIINITISGRILIIFYGLQKNTPAKEKYAF